MKFISFKPIAILLLLWLCIGSTFANNKLNTALLSNVSAQKKPSKDSVIRILAIGNSFSEDAIEYYLHGLASAAGYKIIIGNLYIGGAPLELHLKNATENLPAYDYRKIGLDGKRNKNPKTSLETALADERWDYISFQQASPKSGIFESFQQTLPALYAYVQQRAKNKNVKYIWHQTWAYAQNSTHNGFTTYSKDQTRMYEAIFNASKKVDQLIPISIIVPAGTAIQNARTKLGDVLTRDGYHLDLNVGRYTASCAWFETIFKTAVVGNTYRPEKLNGEEALVAQKSAHKAVKKPFKISKIK